MTWQVKLDEALERARMPGSPMPGWTEQLRHGSMLLGLYAPRAHDPQQPHDQDELYVVMRGSGAFVRGDERVPFVEGDVLFVPAHMPHRFEDFSADFAAWVVFYGPPGGEAAG
jgi:mannose-6-phosphate isomerase-like protein (cupin superfamily)